MTSPLRVVLTVEQCWQPVPGGSGTYVVELTRALASRTDVRVRGLAARHREPAPADWAPVATASHSRLPRPVLYEAWNRLGRPRAEDTLGSVPDVVHATTWAVPPSRSPSVVTVHDLAFRRNPEYFTPRGVRFFERAFERVRAEAAIVVVPSGTTAADCVEAGVEPDRLRVVPHGVRVAEPAPADVAGFRRERGLPDRYLLWTGTREPRKNLPRLLDAFAAVAPDEPDLHLVLVGPRGWGDVPSPRLGERAARVHTVGHLSWPDLQRAYAGAAAFCFPSVWEGFGMPVVESMAHGVPVVTSAGTSMAELVGDAGVLVDPLDESSIAAGIRRAVGPERRALAEAARRRGREFSWTAAAAGTVAAYRDARGAGRS